MAATRRSGNTATVPADGDDYTYVQRKGPQIPAQFISPSRHQAALDEIERQGRVIQALIAATTDLTRRIEALERQTEQWTGD